MTSEIGVFGIIPVKINQIRQRLDFIILVKLTLCIFLLVIGQVWVVTWQLAKQSI
jgi:hypothetical protein